MVLKDIVAISGEPGLFRFIAQGKNSIIVEHLETKVRKSAYGSAKVSSLEDIAIFTENEDIPLGKVFDIIYDKSGGEAVIDSKADTGLLKSWFEEILPDYSREKVYGSDIKKIVIWYNLLQKLNMLVREEPETEPGKKSEVVKESESKPATEKVAAPKKKKSPGKPKAH